MVTVSQPEGHSMFCGKPAAMTISEWLAELSSHDIYDAKGAAEDFEKRTGVKATWVGHSPKQIRAMIKARGLGGTLNAEASGPLIAGYELAENLAHKFADAYRSPANGRGRRFFDCLEALQKAGR